MGCCLSSNSAQGERASNNAQGASNNTQEASNDSQGASNDTQGASNDIQGASTHPQPTPTSRTPSPTNRPPSPTNRPPSLTNRTPPQGAGWYRVYHVLFLGAPSHESIFIETHERGPGSGHLYHVIGNVLRGMKYEDKVMGKPEDSASYEKKSFIGVILSSDIPRFQAVCQSVEVPGAQLDLRGRPLDPSKPPRRCGEWTADAISALHEQGIVRQ